MVFVESKPFPSWTENEYTPVTKYRAKKYVIVVYPDDMPENWMELLRDTMWDIVISPLHDKDLNPDGTVKKAHYHILLSAGNTWITMNELVKLGKQLKGVAIPQQCSNPKGMIRYFTHIDNPEKAQYNQSDITVIGQYDISEFFKPTVGEDRDTRREIVTYIIDNNVYELSDLVVYAMLNNEKWDDYIARNTIYINAIVRSVRHKRGD